MAPESEHGGAQRPTFIERQKSLWMLGTHRISPEVPSDRLVRAKQLGSVVRLFGVTVLGAAAVWAILVLDWGKTSGKAPPPARGSHESLGDPGHQSDASDEVNSLSAPVVREPADETANLRPDPESPPPKQEEWSPPDTEKQGPKGKEDPSTAVLREPWD